MPCITSLQPITDIHYTSRHATHCTSLHFTLHCTAPHYANSRYSEAARSLPLLLLTLNSYLNSYLNCSPGIMRFPGNAATRNGWRFPIATCSAAATKNEQSNVADADNIFKRLLLCLAVCDSRCSFCGSCSADSLGKERPTCRKACKRRLLMEW